MLSWQRATRGKVDGARDEQRRHTSARNVRVICDAAVMTIEANEDRRVPRHTPIWERERRGTPATLSWRRARRGKVDGAGGACRRHVSRETRERFGTPPRRRATQRRRTTSDASEDRRRLGHTPEQERERCEAPATPPWRQAMRGRSTAQEAPAADTRARVVRDVYAVATTSDARDARGIWDAVVRTSDAKTDGASGTRRDRNARDTN